ncbi:beta-glucosidase BglX [Arachidicoccus soli]|uniref:Periplasmic beta-glucosidase n=1 Tax=Arachidicoccus soli TaxID=2341117 RepID=A0A386HUP1_9BACT|nr:beta-glucosidase BglX [Arachidicoccus soli]AYD49462.1 beta-glucosidase BglX [Arachidicoccus soli]
MKKIILILFILPLFVNAQSRKQEQIMDKFVANLMSKMNLNEKIGQLNLPSAGDFTTGQVKNSNIGKSIQEGNVGGLFNIKGVEKIRDIQKVAVEKSRLHIPLIFGMDIIHGYETQFPIPLALSCSWDTALIKQTAQTAAKEASANGICWTYSPMVDISRDPRWGRVAEGSGEDPFLGSQIAKVMVEGYQGDFSSSENILACVKHFALYGAVEAGRDYNTVDMSHLTMYNDYFPPYKAAIDAGVGSVMASFNVVDYVPATGNRWLLTDVLRKQWGFKGFVVTDYTGINEMMEHGMGNLQEVSALALKAGVDMDMVGEGFLTTLKKSLQEHKISLEEINNACRLVLEAKYKLGLFQNPYKYCDINRAATEAFTVQNRALAQKAAEESFVLLKNQDDLLPLKTSGNIAVIGPLADAANQMGGTWSVGANTQENLSVLAAIKKYVGGNAQIAYAQGSNLTEDSALQSRVTMFGKTIYRSDKSDETLLNEALEVAQKSDVIIAALGESAEFSGESSSRSNINIPDVQEKLLKALIKTGKPVVLLLFNGRPLTLPWEEKNVPAILDVWFGGTETGNAVANVLFGKVNPGGKLTMTFPQNGGQIPLYYNHLNTGRPLKKGHWFEKFKSNYLDVSNDPVYPFGFGLSYTSFSYGKLRLSNIALKGNQVLKASVSITNTGNYDGSEVVQLYIRDLVGSISRPVEELKGFRKIFLKAGESKEVSFDITPNDLKFYNADLKYDWQSGKFNIMVGTNSRDIQSQMIEWDK